MSLELRLLGSFEVLVDGEPVALPPSRKTRALFAYLALAERPQRRERLCELFWEVPDDPRGALRWSLSKIRRIVGDAEAARLRADRATVFLDTDGAALDAAPLIGRAGGTLADLPLPELERIAASVRGGFLEDLALDRCPEFEAWRRAVSFEVETARGRLLALLLERLRDDPVRALPHAEALAALDPEDVAARKRVEDLRAAVRGALSSAISAGAALPAAGDPDADTTAAAATLRYATARDGTRIAWSASGEGPTLVRAAHWMSHLEHERESPVWRHWIRTLSEGRRLVRYDERLNGLSDWEAEELTLDAFVGDLEAVVDDAGLDRFSLLGISQGAAISVAYAVRHPERVERLILYGGYARGWRSRGDPDEIARREAMLVLMRQGWGRETPIFGELFAAMFVPGATRDHMARFSELQRRTVSARNAVRLQNAFAGIDIGAELPRVAVPTLVLHARDDQVAPVTEGRALAAAIPGARFVELESANHLLLEDEPAFETFATEVARFLAEPAPPRPAPAVLAHPAQRRRISVLDAELVAPTLALETTELDPAGEGVRLLRLLRTVAEEHGGLVLGESPLGLSVAFGAAEPSEIHAVDACRAALALRAAVERESEGSVRLRIGIDAGDAVVEGEGRARRVGGFLPRRARQLAASLRSAVIALSDEAAAAAGGYASFSSIRPVELGPGRQGRRVFVLEALRSAPSRWHLRSERRLTPFTGRTAELDLLDRCLGLARAGQGRTVFVSGEPGVGKSRLVQEFLARATARGAAVVEAGALEFDRAVPLALVRRLLAPLLGIGEVPAGGVTARASGGPAEVEAALARLGAEALASPVRFALDLGVEDPGWDALLPAQRTHRLADALRRLVALRSRERPVVLVIEDLHWADEESLAAVARLVEGAGRLPVVLLATARPQFRPDWMGLGAVKPVNLDVLGPEEARRLVASLVGPHPSVAILRRLLVEQTDGTPLMIEETVGALVQSGRLTGEAGAYVARPPVVEIEPTASVAPVIAARIDRLAPAERHLLQIASIVGRDGPLDILRRLSGLDPRTFDDALVAVERGDFLHEIIGRDEPSYSFKHALIRDAAYASIVEDRRRALHGMAFEGILAGSPGPAAAPVERLAHHAYLAGRWADAVPWLMRAAERAIERSAYARAIAALERAASALEALEETPATRLAAIDVRVTMQVAHAALGNFAAAVERISEACDLAAAAEHPERLGHALLKLAYTFGTCGRLDEALAAADRLRRHAEANGLTRHAAEADIAAGFVRLMQGDARAALGHLLPHRGQFGGALRHERFGLLNTRSVWLQGSIAHAAALLGDLPLAEAAIAEALAVAAETGRPQDRHCVQQFALQVEIARGPSDRMLAATESLLADSLDEWLFPAGPWLLASLGDALLARGRLDAAEVALERAYEAADTAGMRGIATLASRLLATVHALTGDEDAAAELRDLLATGGGLPVWLRARMRLALAATSGDAEAEDLLSRAVDEARAAGLRPDAARCLDVLAARLRARDPSRAAAAQDEAEALRREMSGLAPAG